MALTKSRCKTNIVIDTELSSTSTNGVQNKVIKTTLDNLDTAITNANNNANNRSLLLVDRLRPVTTSKTTLTITNNFTGLDSKWPDRITSIYFLVPHSTAGYVGGGLYAPMTITPNTSDTSYSYTDNTSGYNKSVTHVFKIERYSAIRFTNYAYECGDMTTLPLWYSARSTSSLIGQGRFCYIRFKSASVTMGVYNDASNDWLNNRTTTFTSRFFNVTSGTVEYFISDT